MNVEAVLPELISARPVDPSAIERELSALWMAEAEARKKSAGGDKALARTLLTNLLIFAPDESVVHQAREFMRALTGRQPSRIILMLVDERAQRSGLQAWISMQCETRPDGASEVCGEQITLLAEGGAVFDLPGTVLPLLLTDMPAFLWWQAGNPFRHRVFEDLAPAMDRIILDSLTFTAPLTDFADMARMVADREGRFPVILGDLGWTRLNPWRSLTAQLFDPQAARPYLAQLEHVRIAYFDGPPTLAWLFAGWLASRLGWEPVDKDALAMRFEGGPIVEFRALPAGAAPAGFFAGLEMTARDGAGFEVARLPKDCAVTRSLVGGVKTERVVPVRYETLPDWLGHELNRLSRSATFEAAVRLVAGAATRAHAPEG